MALKAINIYDVPNLEQLHQNSGRHIHITEGEMIVNEGDDEECGTLAPRKFAVLGHRGSGMNLLQSPDPRMKMIKENSIRSFNAAGRFNVDYIEFDVQVTKDGCPVIFHDNFIMTEKKGKMVKRRVTEMTLDDFLSYGPQKEAEKVEKLLFRETIEGEIFEWKVEENDYLCTLEEVFEKANRSLGFNIELKFDENIDYTEQKLSQVIQAVLQVVSNSAKTRPVFFSSFQPDAALLIRKMQNTYPVYFLTNGGSRVFTDIRRNSIDEAIKLCMAGTLQGIVCEAKAVLRNPEAVSRIKDSNLSVLSFGLANNSADAVYVQYLMGVEGVVVDLIEEITEIASKFRRAIDNGRETIKFDRTFCSQDELVLDHMRAMSSNL